MTAEEREAHRGKLANECKGKEGATDADLAEFTARDKPSTPTAKCLHACIGETLGFVMLIEIRIQTKIEECQNLFIIFFQYLSHNLR